MNSNPLTHIRSCSLVVGLALSLGALAQPASTNMVYDVSRDFSHSANPNGVWSYGWKSSLDGPFTLLSVPAIYRVQNGVYVQQWLAPGLSVPVLQYNGSDAIAIHDSGGGYYPPGTVWAIPGLDGHPQNFSVIRFTVPSQQAGAYYLATAVQSYLDGNSSRDADFHVVLNGAEVFRQFLAPRTGTGYTNTLSLVPGDTVDFMVGRGADGILYGSGLKIQASLTHPAVCTPHRATATATVVNGFVVGATITDAGCGYANAAPPVVSIEGGGGSGAAATATVSNGVVAAVNIVSAGSGYTSAPRIVIASPPMAPTVTIEVSTVKVTQNVTLGLNYVLESSFDLVTWTPAGPPFTAEAEMIVNEFDVAETGRYFRIRQVP